MINIFCTRKLETFINVKKKDENYDETRESWICHLIAIAGKKSLYFIDKKTLYSILIINVQKKDLHNIEQMFVDALINQLKTDKILNTENEPSIRNRYKSSIFYETDNDQKTLGTLRDQTLHIKNYLSGKLDKIEAAKNFMQIIGNTIPLGSRKYAFAKDLMFEALRNI